ncbi:hypothetical protein GCM10009540_30350 [Streptomyces turgidiscabies]
MIPDDRNRPHGWEGGRSNSPTVCGERYPHCAERSFGPDERHPRSPGAPLPGHRLSASRPTGAAPDPCRTSCRPNSHTVDNMSSTRSLATAELRARGATSRVQDNENEKVTYQHVQNRG